MDIPFEIYGIFLFQKCVPVDDVIILSYMHVCTFLLPLCAQTVIFIGLKYGIFIGLKYGPPSVELFLHAMV
jgi:hypothetical protein